MFFRKYHYLCNPIRDLSSVGLERLLHTQEVSSSNLLGPTLCDQAFRLVFLLIIPPLSVGRPPAGRDVARGKSGDVVDFCRLAKIHDTRTPSGPRLAPQAAGPSTRPDEAGVTFPRRDTLPGIAFGRYVSFITLSPQFFSSHSHNLFLSVARVGRISALCLTTPSES